MLVSLSQEKKYTATTTLLFQGSNVNADEAERQVATTTELVTLPVVAKRASKVLGGSITPPEVLASISINAGSTVADIGKISATTTDPRLSARIADAYSRAYIAFRREADQSQVEQAIALVQTSLKDLTPEEFSGDRGKSLQERLTRLKVEQALQTGKAVLVQPATVPSTPSSPKTKRNVALGVVLGALLGLALVALLERVDRRVRTIEELEELFGTPLIGSIPRSRKVAKGDLADILHAPEAEAFRILRSNLRFYNVDEPLRTILVASPEAGDGKSTVARCLAATMAEMGDNVVLVEADLRKGGEYRAADGGAAAGLSNLLVAPVPFDPYVRVEIPASISEQTRILSILPSGPIPPNPGELLESDKMHTLIAELQGHFDLVVIDSPALGIVSDALALIPEVSGLLVVGGIGKTTRDGARSFTKQLSRLHVEPLGLVANFAPPEPKRYSYYHKPPATAGR